MIIMILNNNYDLNKSLFCFIKAFFSKTVSFYEIKQEYLFFRKRCGEFKKNI